ncbi:uncharacterized protein N7506_000062 [Penicillium brevicompactum]|uniref:uncharacterized protein n=1 Tax=Penicillium brevicompactum TaxID=5074 RepID=UPI00254142FD|nr:uncharacterized protein N7506_000062 [Penicillium brevicompactum]KAJ5346809.1 hypothetical protein N7506_000062 [Penicillium brevicompactum]
MVKPVRQRPSRKPLTTTQAWTKVETTAYRLGAAEYLGNKDSNLTENIDSFFSGKKYAALKAYACAPSRLAMTISET